MKKLLRKIKLWFERRILGIKYFIGRDFGSEDKDCEVVIKRKRNGILKIVDIKYYE